MVGLPIPAYRIRMLPQEHSTYFVGQIIIIIMAPKACDNTTEIEGAIVSPKTLKDLVLSPPHAFFMRAPRAPGPRPTFPPNGRRCVPMRLVAVPRILSSSPAHRYGPDADCILDELAASDWGEG